MATITRFEEVEAWQTARQLTRLIYTLTDKGRFAKDFGLRNQIQRASVSVMSNIADGFESRTQAQFVEFLGRAKASAGEVRCQLYVAVDLKYLAEDQFAVAFDLADKVSRQLARLIRYLESHSGSQRIREDNTAYET